MALPKSGKKIKYNLYILILKWCKQKQKKKVRIIQVQYSYYEVLWTKTKKKVHSKKKFVVCGNGIAEIGKR